MSKLRILLVLFSLLVLATVGCAPSPDPGESPGPAPEEESNDEASHQEDDQDVEAPHENEDGDGPVTMALTSPAFNQEQAIPEKYSCDGEDISPELDWFGTPEGTVSLALIMDDPDAPMGTWVHWVLFNLPMDLSGLREGMTGVGLDGTNSWNTTGYGGPCPPSGTHRYFFKLYALDLVLDLDAGADKGAVLSAMDGHILGEAELMGTYSR